MTQIGFQIDALSKLPDWSMLSQLEFDWLRVSSYQHHYDYLIVDNEKTSLKNLLLLMDVNRSVDKSNYGRIVNRRCDLGYDIFNISLFKTGKLL